MLCRLREAKNRRYAGVRSLKNLHPLIPCPTTEDPRQPFFQDRPGGGIGTAAQSAKSVGQKFLRVQTQKLD